jgi:hypothetical protein
MRHTTVVQHYSDLFIAKVPVVFLPSSFWILDYLSTAAGPLFSTSFFIIFLDYSRLSMESIK